jgi:hypothetical protein
MYMIWTQSIGVERRTATGEDTKAIFLIPKEGFHYADATDGCVAL